MTEMLTLENQMLREFIDLSNSNHELEVAETVLDCIEQEGCVSKSIETMFGESFENKDEFAEQLMGAYMSAVEGFIKNAFNEDLDDSKTDIVINKLRNGVKTVKKLISEKGKGITFPIKLPRAEKFRTIDNLRQFVIAVTEKYQKLHYEEAYQEVERFKNEPSKYAKDVRLDSVDDIKKFLEEIDRLILEEGHFVRQFKDFVYVAKRITEHELINHNGPRFKMLPAQIQRLASFGFRTATMFYVQSLNKIIAQIKNPKVDRKDDFEF